MTLQEMMTEVINNTMAKVVIPYSGYDSKNNANKILSALNYIYKKIAQERYNLIFTQNVTLDGNLSFDTTILTKQFYKIKSLTFNGCPVLWDNDEVIKCPYNSVGDVLELKYCYTPSELTFANMTEIPLIKCDHRILCYYACFQFLMGNGQDTRNWLDLFNDGFNNIRQTRGKSRRVRGA